MKKLTPMLFLLLSVSTCAAGNTEQKPVSPGPTPLQLNMSERLLLFSRIFCLQNLPVYNAADSIKLRELYGIYLNKDSLIRAHGLYPLSALTELAMRDFVLCNTASSESLSLQQKADIINAFIGWPGFVAVDSAQHFIWYDYTIPQKVYGKKLMKELSQRYAALTYTWLLRNEDIKKWSMMVHFSKQFKRRIKNLGYRVYNYVGEVYFHSIPDPTFDEVLAVQLRKKNQ